jgi:hypothetical protein
MEPLLLCHTCQLWGDMQDKHIHPTQNYAASRSMLQSSKAVNLSLL